MLSYCILYCSQVECATQLTCKVEISNGLFLFKMLDQRRGRRINRFDMLKSVDSESFYKFGVGANGSGPPPVAK